MAGELVPNVPEVPQIGQVPQQPHLQRAQKQQEALQKLSQLPFKRIQRKTLKKGSLVTFQYLFWKHDPYPLVLCSSLFTDHKLAGINLHYLTFRYLRYLVKMYCDKQFSYSLIRNNQFIARAYRTYKGNGLRNVKLMDCEYLLSVLGAARSFQPTEIETIRKYVQEQLRQKINPTADELANQYTEMLQLKANELKRPDARTIPKDITSPEPYGGL